MARLAVDKQALFRHLDYVPHPVQLEVHLSTARRRALACGVRWGKTLCAAMEGLAAALEPKERSMGWIVAPTYDLADKVFRELLLVAATKLRHRVVAMKENERRLVIRNLGGGVSEIRGKSADNPVSLLGEGLDWVVVDEAARLKPAIWEGHLSQRLIDKKGWALLISTPRGKGWFFELFHRGKRGDPDHASWNCPSWSNPYLDAATIEAERGRLPERVFRQEYGGEFLEGAGQVFRYVRERATGAWSEPVRGNRYIAGLDLAKVSDYTVLAVIDRAERRVVHVERFNRVDWSVQLARVSSTTRRYNRAWTHVDSTGAGEPIFEALARAGCTVAPYPFTAKSKAALIDNLAMLLEREMLILPRPDLWPEGIDELEAFEYSVTDSGNVRTGSPAGSHDDCVIGLALAAWPLKVGQVASQGRTTGWY
ncbi:MAG TPA: hypothetical protein VJP77_04445 [Planctomycetota bacterium]|nr:hypothetical protein [Planctomycetota bacterium]